MRRKTNPLAIVFSIVAVIISVVIAAVIVKIFGPALGKWVTFIFFVIVAGVGGFGVMLVSYIFNKRR